MTNLEREIILLTLIHEMTATGDPISEICRPSGVVITMRGLLVFLDGSGYTHQAKTLKTVLGEYIGEDQLFDMEIMDFSKETRGMYPYPLVTNIMKAAISNVTPNYISTFLASFPYRRNELERAIRAEFAERFIATTGAIKTMARYIRIDMSRRVYNVTWSTLHDEQAFLDSIIKYKIVTELETGKTGKMLRPMTLLIPELNITLDLAIA